jgi:hypothetical protein
LHKKRDPKVSVYQRRNPPLGIGVPKSGSSGIREHGRLNVQRFLGRWIVPGLPPGFSWNILGFASATVPPVMLTVVASIRGRTNSLVISFNVEDIVTHP